MVDLFKPGGPTQIPEDLKRVFDHIGDQDISKWDSKQLVEFAKGLDGITDETINFLGQAEPAKDLQVQWNKYTSKGTKFMQQYGSAIKSTAVSMGVMLVAAVAIKALTTAFDYLNVTLEEQREKTDAVKSKLDELTTEYDNLKKISNPTDTEKSRIKMLERQIELQETLYKAEMKRLAASELEGEGDIFSEGKLADTHDDGTFGRGNHVAITGQQTKSSSIVGQIESDTEDILSALTEQREKISEIDNFDGWASGMAITREADLISQLEAQKTKALEQHQAYSDSYELIKKYMDAGTWDDDPEEKAKWQAKMDMYEQGMYDLQATADKIDLELGVTIDVDAAKRFLIDKVDGVDEEWLNTLTDQEIDYLYRLENIGELTPDELKGKIDDLRNEAEKPINVEIETSSYIADLEKMSDGFEKVAAVYNDVKDAGDFDFGSLTKDSDFGAIFSATKGFEEFVDVVSNAPDDISACQSAFNSLVTEWFYGQEPLQNITKETYDLTVAWLQQKGVTNAVEVANRALAESEARAWLATKDLKEVTQEQIDSFVAENSTIGVTNEMMQLLRLEMLETSLTDMNLSEQIGEVTAFAVACGIAKDANEAMNLGIGGRKGAHLAERAGMSTSEYAVSVIREKINDARTQIDYAPTGGGSSGGGGGSASDPWSAEIDKYEKYTRAVEEVESALSDLSKIYEHTDDVEERIALKQQEINLYGQQQKAIEDLNNARDKEIGANVNTLRGKGFKIDYDPLTDSLVIHNKELVNTMNASDDTKQELWKLIEASEELNDANKESTEQWKELSYSILENRDALEELHNERFDEAIADAEHLIELFSKRGDVVDEDLQLMGGIMTALEKELQRLAKEGTEADKDRIKELQKMWMDYYDSRIERENEILEKQLEDRDGVLSAIDNLFNERIENIDKEIEALQKTNEERKSAIELQKAQAALDKAQSQKTRRVLRAGVGWVYEADEDAIKEAEENLADIEFEQSIETLEKQKEALEELQNKWAEIPDEYEKYRNELLAEERLGSDWEDDVLDGRISVFNDFKDEYFDIQEQIYLNTKELNEHMADEYQKMMDMFANMIAMFNMPDVAETTVNKGHKEWYVGKDGKAPKEANVGDIVYTKGGTYRIDAKDENGKFTSTKIDDKSTAIPEGLWGTEIKKGTADLTDVVGMNVITNQDLIARSEEQLEEIKKNILESDELQTFLKNNTDITREDVDAVLENMDYTDILSGETDDNTDATGDNTKALRDLIYALANLELEIPIEEIPEDPFADLDWGSMTPDEKSWIKQLQTAYETAMRQGNEIFAQGVLQQLQDFKDGFGEEYIQIGKDAYAAATAPYGKTSNSKIEDDDRLADLEDQLERAKSSGNTSLANRIEDAIAVVKYGEGYEKDSNSNGYVTQSIITAVNAAESFMTADELKKKHEYDNGAIDNGFDYSEMGAVIAGRVQEAIDNPYNNDWNVITNDFGTLSKEVQLDELKEIKSTLENAYKQDVSAINKNIDVNQDLNDTVLDSTDAVLDATDTIENSAKKVADAYNSFMSAVQSSSSSNKSSGSSGGSGGGGNKGGSDPTNSAEYKQYAYAKALAESQGNKEAAALAQANMDRITKGTYVSNSAGTSKGSGYSSGSKVVGSATTTSKDNGNGTTTHTVKTSTGNTYSYTTKNKAKGGTGLSADIYNVDEKGPELLIEPDEGRFVRIRQGGNVIPADVSKKLWEFGANPKSFLRDMISRNTVKINPQIINMTTVPSGLGTSGSTEINYHIDKIELPNVIDGNSFIKELQNLPNLAKQWATRK